MMRGILHSLHTWGGLTLGLLIAVVGLTGSALVFRADIERWQARDWLQVQPAAQRLSLDQIVAVGAAQIPAKEVVRVVLPQAPDEAVEVLLQKRRPRNLADADLVGVFVDPYRGVALGQLARARGWLWTLQDFHYALLAGNPGLKFNGVGAAVLLALAITGPILWWPGWAQRRFAFRVRSRPAAARWRDLHAIGGVLACLVLALIAATALYYAYRSTATAVVALASGSGGVAPPRIADIAPPAPVDAQRYDSTAPDPAARPRASLDALLASATAAVPGARLDELRPSRAPTAPAVMSFRLPDDVVFGRHRLYLDARDARLMRIDLHDELPLGARLLANMAPWHFGTFGGRLTQWLWFVAGLLPAALFGTGLWLWLKRRRRAPAGAAAAAAPAGASYAMTGTPR